MYEDCDRLTLLVTGGAGFIGSNFAHRWLAKRRGGLVVLDKMTYAGNRANLAAISADPRLSLVVDDIGDHQAVQRLLAGRRPAAIVNFAAETHVDRSIASPSRFVETNVVGTLALLEETRAYWQNMSDSERARFCLVHISTDEVYGSLGLSEPAFQECSPYAPNSPYAASKAGSDHLVRAFNRTYGLPTLTINCSNNYGPRQFPEKLIPLVILNALAGKPLPIYGAGRNVRDWLYVEDHCDAVIAVLEHGRAGETYNVGGHCEMANVDVVQLVCSTLDELRPDSRFRPHARLIEHVRDRPGHDLRYAVDASKIEREIGWRPGVTLPEGIRRTVSWYLANSEWAQAVTGAAYHEWIAANYGGRKS